MTGALRVAESQRSSTADAAPLAVMTMPELDAHLLHTTLRDELRAAWLRIHAEFGAERIYGFGLYTIDSAAWVRAVAFSEKTLDDLVARQVAAFSDGGREPELRLFALRRGGTPDDAALQRQSLRWHLHDSPLGRFADTLLPKSGQILRELDLEGRWRNDADMDDDEFEEALEQGDPDVDEVFRVFHQSLADLDLEGVFGHGPARHRLVLSIWEGDQSDEARYAFAKALNPPTVVARFGREMNEGAHACDRLFHGPEVQREDSVFE